MLAVSVTARGFLTRIPFAPLPLVVLGALLAWYLLSVRRVNARGGLWPAPRTAAWAAGVAVAAFAMCTGMASWDATSLTVHGTIDMLVGLVSPLLLVLGAPLTLARESRGAPVALAPESAPEQQAWDAHGRLGGAAAWVATNPVVTWIVFAGSLFGLYFTPFFRVARGHEVLLQLGHLELLAAGFLWALPMAGAHVFARRLHPGFRIVYLLLGMVVFTIFGMGLESRTTSGVPGLPVAGLRAAGDIIWSAGVVTAIVGSVGILYYWLFSDLARAKAEEAVDTEELAMQASLWRVSRILAKPDYVKEAERQAAIKAETIAATDRRRHSSEA